MNARTRRALCELERALGWDPRRKARKGTFGQRLKTAKDSSGLGDLIAPAWQARAIRKALAKLHAAEQAEREEREAARKKSEAIRQVVSAMRDDRAEDER